MTDYQLAVPLVYCLAGFFLFGTAAIFAFLREHLIMVLFWLGMGFLFISNGVFSAYLLARDAAAADLSVAGTVGILLGVNAFFWSLLYFVIIGFSEGGRMLIKWRPPR